MPILMFKKKFLAWDEYGMVEAKIKLHRIGTRILRYQSPYPLTYATSKQLWD